MVFIAIISLALMHYTLARKYGWNCVIHPGTWFGAAWILALASYAAFAAVDAVPVRDSALFNQLMTFITVTAVTFGVLPYLSSTSLARNRPGACPLIPINIKQALKSAAAVGGLAAVANWIALGAPLGYNDGLRQQWLEQIPTITARLWWPYLLTFPSAISSGWLLSTGFLHSAAPRRSVRTAMLVPLGAGLFWALGTGGRQAFGMVILHYFVGLAFGWHYGIARGCVVSVQRLRRAITNGLLIGLLLSGFVGITGMSRARQQGGHASAFDSVWYLAPVGQFIDYMGMTIATHQAYGEPKRRDLSETGPVSLAGFQQLGFSYLTGWRQPVAADTNPERALAASGLPLASGTRDAYYDLQADFGYTGAIVVVLILVIVSHCLFLLHVRHAYRISMLSIAPLAMILMFWGYSHQLSLFMFGSFKWLIISAVAWDFICLLAKLSYTCPAQMPASGTIARGTKA